MKCMVVLIGLCCGTIICEAGGDGEAAGREEVSGEATRRNGPTSQPDQVSLVDALSRLSTDTVTVRLSHDVTPDVRQRKVHIGREVTSRWDALASISRETGLGFRPLWENGEVIELAPKLPPVREWRSDGHATVCLFHPAGVPLTYEVDKDAYGIAILASHDAIETDYIRAGPEFQTIRGKSVASTQPEFKTSSPSCRYGVFYPMQRTGEQVTLRVNLRYMVLKDPIEVRCDLVEGGVWRKDDIQLHVIGWLSGNAVTRVRFLIGWDSRLRPQDAARYRAAVETVTGGKALPVEEEDWLHAISRQMHWVNVRFVGVEIKDEILTGRSATISTTRLNATGLLTLDNPVPPGARLVLRLWRVRPEDLKQGSFDFVLGGRSGPGGSPE